MLMGQQISSYTPSTHGNHWDTTLAAARACEQAGLDSVWLADHFMFPDQANPENEKALEAVKAPEDLAKLGFFQRAQLASAAAWSPDPKNLPLYLDLPTKNGEPQPDVLAKWTANAPLAFIDQYIDQLRTYHGISIDVGDQDGLRVDTAKLHEVLDKYGIANSFEIYSGTHTSKVADRFQNHVMPFFSQNLCFQAKCQ